MRTLLVILVVVFAGLFATNPNMPQFERHVKTETQVFLIQESQGSLSRALSGTLSELAADQVKTVADRENYWVASVYTIDVDGEYGNTQEWRFLAIGGNFFELDRPDALK